MIQKYKGLSIEVGVQIRDDIGPKINDHDETLLRKWEDGCTQRIKELRDKLGVNTSQISTTS